MYFSGSLILLQFKETCELPWCIEQMKTIIQIRYHYVCVLFLSNTRCCCWECHCGKRFCKTKEQKFQYFKIFWSVCGPFGLTDIHRARSYEMYIPAARNMRDKRPPAVYKLHYSLASLRSIVKLQRLQGGRRLPDTWRWWVILSVQYMSKWIRNTWLSTRWTFAFKAD